MIRVGVIGHKQVPSYNGGIEAVLTEMIPLLDNNEVELTIYNRWTTFYKISEWKNKQSYGGHRIVRIPTFKKSFLNAFVYSVLASIHASFTRCNIIHYHAEGPSAMAFIPKAFGKKIVCTNHGIDWNRSKWGGFATKYLKFGEKVSANKSDALIVLSKTIQKYFKDSYNKDTILTRNGINIQDRIDPNIITDKFGLNKHGYYLAVGRMVPEKGFNYLVLAYSKLNTDVKLVIAGELVPTDYCTNLQELAKGNDNIIFTGFVEGEIKQELFSNAYAYVIPSDLEGMSISLLEALSYGCSIIASDIPENTNIYDEGISFFKQSDIDSLLKMLETVKPHSEENRDKQINFVKNHYNWKHIVEETIDIYREVMGSEKSKHKGKEI